MADLQPSLGIVRAMLATIAKTVGCSVDYFQLTVQLGEFVYLDVVDEDFEGTVDLRALTPALKECLSAALGRPVFGGGPCTNEGGVLSVQVYFDDTVVLRVGV